MFVAPVSVRSSQSSIIRASLRYGHNFIVIGTEVGLAAEYSINTGTGTTTLIRDCQMPSGIVCIEMYGGGLVFGLENGQIILQREDGSLLLMSSRSTERISCMAVCGDYLFAGSWDSSLYVYKGTQFVRAFSDLAGKSVLALCNINDKYIVVGGANGGISVADVGTIERDAQVKWNTLYNAHAHPVRSIVNLTLGHKMEETCCIEDGAAFIASTGNDGILHLHAIYNQPTLHIDPEPLLTHDDPYSLNQYTYSLSYDPDTCSLVMGGADITFSIGTISWEEVEDEDGVLTEEDKVIVSPSYKLTRKVPTVSLIWNCDIIGMSDKEFFIITTGESKMLEVFHCVKNPKDVAELKAYLASDVSSLYAVDAEESGMSKFGKYNLIPASRFTNSHKSVIPTHDLLGRDEVLGVTPYPEGMILLAKDPCSESNANVFCSTGGRWVEVGYVTPGDGNGAPTKIPAPDGRLYDFEFPIEVRDMKYSMFANRGENPYLITERVLEQNPNMTPGMDLESYKRQISEFLITQLPTDKVQGVFKRLVKRGIKKTAKDLVTKAGESCLKTLRSHGIDTELLELLLVGAEAPTLDRSIVEMFDPIYSFIGTLLWGTKPLGEEEVAQSARLTSGNEIFPFLIIIIYMMDNEFAANKNVNGITHMFSGFTLHGCVSTLMAKANSTTKLSPIFHVNITRMLCILFIYLMKGVIAKGSSTWLDWSKENDEISEILLHLQLWLCKAFNSTPSQVPTALKDRIREDIASFFDLSLRYKRCFPNVVFLL